MGELDFSGREQLYYQLYNILFEKIVNGIYPLGSLIPAESELMKQYHVSRATARKSMEMLANDGMVNKKRGYGTVVVSNTPNTSPKRVVSYTRKNNADHVTPIKRMIDKRIIAAPKEIAIKLHLPDESKLFQLKRVRCAGERPFYVEINYFDERLVPGIMDRDFSNESLRVYLSNTYHIHWSYAEQEIYSILSNEELSSLLQIPLGSPLLYIKRISYDTDNVPREFVSTYYRADTYHLEIELAL